MTETAGCTRVNESATSEWRTASRGDSQQCDDRGVSDLIGFVLTFALIITMVGVVYTAGLAELKTTRDAERVDNAERAFVVLGSNIDDLVHRGAPSRATSVRLSGASIEYGTPVTFNLTFTGSGQSYVATVDPIRYATDDGGDIVYVNGAIIRDQRGGNVMVREPPIVFGKRTIVPFIVTRKGGGSIGGETTAVVRTTLSSRTTFVRRVDLQQDVILSVDTPRAALWADYVEAESSGTCTVAADGDRVTCTLSPTRAYVPLAKVDVRLI